MSRRQPGCGRPSNSLLRVRSAAFKTIAGAAGLDPTAWTPRELRHSFVSLLSSSGLPIEQISHLVGHASTVVTERVYRRELRPLLSQRDASNGRDLQRETGSLGWQLGRRARSLAVH
jgi:integrase